MAIPVLLLLLLFADIATATFKICAFNIKSFGEAKASNRKVMSILVKILSRCDISAIQEVRDLKGEAIPALGLPPAGLYITGVYSFLKAIKDFALISHHTCPREAAKEINKLLLVMLEVKSRWRMENIMLLGDLNASCSYLTMDQWKEIQIRSGSYFHWLIGDKEDTTVRQKTHCAYDRCWLRPFLLHSNAMQSFPCVLEVSSTCREGKWMERHRQNLTCEYITSGSGVVCVCVIIMCLSEQSVCL
uniref:Endonuclease/exonuclease/phosphatase domain-containing protein n=1 Tax=Leptobrachium leishanense TaxID=445787 RepID=A0A8C5PJY8_9ANUR